MLSPASCRYPFLFRRGSAGGPAAEGVFISPLNFAAAKLSSHPREGGGETLGLLPPPAGWGPGCPVPGGCSGGWKLQLAKAAGAPACSRRLSPAPGSEMGLAGLAGRTEGAMREQLLLCRSLLLAGTGSDFVYVLRSAMLNYRRTRAPGSREKASARWHSAGEPGAPAPGFGGGQGGSGGESLSWATKCSSVVLS